MSGLSSDPPKRGRVDPLPSVSRAAAAGIHWTGGWVREAPAGSASHTRETWSLGPQASGVGWGGARLRKPHSKPSTAGWEEPFRDAPGFRGRLSAQITARWLTWAPPCPEPLGARDLLHSRAGGSGLALPGPQLGLWLGRPHVGESGFSPHCEGRGLPARDVPSDLAVTWVPTPDVHTHSCLHISTHSFTCTQSPTLQHTCSCPYTCTHLTFTPPPLSQASPQTPLR